MPRRPITVRRWQIALAFLALTVAYVVGLAALTAVHNSDARVRRERVAEVNRSIARTCRARHYLAVGLIAADDALAEVERTSIVETRQLGKIPGFTAADRRAALLNARSFLRRIAAARRLAAAADCSGDGHPLTGG